MDVNKLLCEMPDDLIIDRLLPTLGTIPRPFNVADSIERTKKRKLLGFEHA